ncbi:hypothetical protein Q31b_16770 [Novipirellula aureliae]|uniref:Uncharacterized protein n=1 Tax=Novipirellula aureliae TaxID=2527966 RepID=A0A5C6E8V3_9BACT|nr:hypothetical protein [Novipirellula aureliae]TWU44141.1 hypothetical protein Q31b_16770 [Novipirellula aureliae]
MSSIKLAIVVFFTMTVITWASEPDELRNKARVLRQEAAELAEHGHQEKATNLKRKAMAMLEEAGQLEHHDPDQHRAEIVELQRLLERLHQEQKKLEVIVGKGERLADVRQQAERVEMKLRAISGQPVHKESTPQDKIAQRLEHMRIAIDHLHQAGLHDVADQVVEQAEATERELHERQKLPGDDVMHDIMKQLDQIRNEVRRLRGEVNELKEMR